MAVVVAEGNDAGCEDENLDDDDSVYSPGAKPR